MSVRVLHVVATNERRGAELFAADLVRSLREDGFEQRVAVLRAAEGSVASFEAPTHALGGARPAVRFGIARAKALRRLVRGWGPQVVQAHGGEALKYSVPAALGSGIPVVYRRIGSAHPWVTDAARRGLYGWLIRRADLVIGVSELVRRETVDVYGVRLDRTLVVPNGVDPDRVRASRTRDEVRASLGVGLDAPLLLSVGALTWEKDPLALLDVAGRVLDQSRRRVPRPGGERAAQVPGRVGGGDGSPRRAHPVARCSRRRRRSARGGGRPRVVESHRRDARRASSRRGSPRSAGRVVRRRRGAGGGRGRRDGRPRTARRSGGAERGHPSSDASTRSSAPRWGVPRRSASADGSTSRRSLDGTRRSTARSSARPRRARTSRSTDAGVPGWEPGYPAGRTGGA